MRPVFGCCWRGKEEGVLTAVNGTEKGELRHQEGAVKIKMRTGIKFFAHFFWLCAKKELLLRTLNNKYSIIIHFNNN